MKAQIGAARREADAHRIAEEHKDCLTRRPWTAKEILVHETGDAALRRPRLRPFAGARTAGRGVSAVVEPVIEFDRTDLGNTLHFAMATDT